MSEEKRGPGDQLDYHRMVQDALRGVVAKSLQSVIDHGLPGDHHFYIGFATDVDGVHVPDSLRARYPEHMTIILQHDFHRLEVDDEGFSVNLRFSGVPQRIAVPFSALISFYDPSVSFVLKFEPEEEDDASATSAKGRPPVRAVLAAADRLNAEKEAAQRTEEDAESVGNQDNARSKRFGARSVDAKSEKESSRKQAMKKPPTSKAAKSKAAKSKAAKNQDIEAKDSKTRDPNGEHDEPSPPERSNVVSIDSFRRK